MTIPESKSSTKTDKLRTGRIGERAVADAYIQNGYSVVAQNVREGHLEIDLIVKNETHLVFIEVKTRHASYGVRSRYGRPADAVDKTKRARTVAAAEAYLRRCPTSLQPRIDVAEVYLSRKADGTDTVTRVAVFRNAFGAR